MRLSLAMIVKDEEQVIERVLSCARSFCDELVVVDTGSTDKTVEIAERLGAKVFHFEWINDFAAARNCSFSHCTGEWIIWLDADDVVPPESQAKIRELMSQPIDESVDRIVCSYDIAFAPDGQCLISMPRERILRRASGGQWEYPIHEAFVQPENTRYMNRLDIRIEHHKPEVYVERSSDRNLLMLEKLIAQGDRSARNLYYYGKELKAHQRPEEAIRAFQEHLEANPEKNATRYQALHQMMLCAMELQQEAQAIQWGLQAIEVDCSRAEAYMELGVIYYRQKAFAGAIPLLHAASTARRPTTGSIQEADYTWRPYHYLSLCYEGLGEYQQAIDAATKALRTIPDKAVVISNIQCFASKLSSQQTPSQ